MEPEDVIEREVAAFNAHDLEGFLAMFAPDAILEGIDGADGPLRGHDAIRPLYARRFSQPGLHATIKNRARMGGWVIDREVISNDAATFEAIAVYEVRDGLIRRATLVRAPSPG